MKTLSRGQRLPLPESGTLSVEVEATGGPAEAVTLGAVLVSGRGRAGSSSMVHPRVLRSPCGSIQLRPADGGAGSYAVVPDRIPPEVETVDLVAWVAEDARRTAASLRRLGQLRLMISQGQHSLGEITIRGDELGQEAALVLLRLYRKNGWRLKVEATGFVGGLPSMLSHYSLDSSLAGVIDGRGGSSGGGRLGGTSPLPVPPRPTPGGGGEFTGIRLASDWPGRVKPEGPAELVRGVARVVVQTTGEQLATGTGFAINPGGVFLTCHHVVEDAAAVGVVFDGNTEVRPVEVLASDPHGDVAVLRISDGHGAEHWLQLADVDDEPKLGQDLGLLGYPLGEVGLEVTYSQGVVNSLRSTSTHKILQIDAGAAPGSSGGPVFRREDGRVIGILGSGLQGRAGMLANFAMDIRQIWALGWVPQ